ncbi:MAG: type II secretion system F family protein [Eubacteriales bacterium]|jgi:tight adherence protein C
MGTLGLVAVSALITILTAFYVVFWTLGHRYDYIIKDLPIGSYPCKCLYTFGMELLSKIRYNYTSLYDRKIERYFRILHGKKYSVFFRHIFMSRMISVTFMVFILLLLLSVIINAWIALLFAFFGAAGMVYYYDKDLKEKVDRRREQIRKDFPEALSTMTLLVNAGLILDQAWRVTAQSSSGLLYNEMRRATVKIDNGVSRFDAWREFAERCGEPYVDKVISALLQNLSKGNRELVAFLKRVSEESWSERKHSVRRKGETASARMLLPIVLTFVGILIMVMMPIMSTGTA